MRTPLLTLLLVVVPLVGCGRAEPFEEPPPPGHARVEASPPAPVTNRVRLSASFLATQGVRFDDLQVLTRTQDNPRCGPGVVRDAAGNVVEGEAARMDLQTYLGRGLTLTAEGGELCALPDKVASLEQLAPAGCTYWHQLANLHTNTDLVTSAAGTGLLLRTARSGEFMLRVVESGSDGETHYVVLEYASSR